MVDMSVKPARLDVQRLPLTSTRVRCSPRLYRFTYWPPCSGLEVSTAALLKVWVPETVRFCRMSPTLTRPDFLMSSEDTVKIGWAVSTSTERMREPVTWMRSRLVAPEVASCACAVATDAPATSAMTTASRSLLDLKFIGSLSPRKSWLGYCLRAERKMSFQKNARLNR